MSTRKSFIIHKDSLSILDDLSDEEAGQLFKAIKSYQLDEEKELSSLIKIAFSPFKNQFVRDAEKYLNTVERNRINGSKGGRPPNPENPEEPSGLTGNPTKPKKADSDSKSDSDSDSDSKSKETKPRAQFEKPSLIDIENHMLAKGLDFEQAKDQSERFYNYYESNGWKVGKNKMVNWKSSASGWLSRNNDFKKPTLDINSTGWEHG